MTTNFVSDNLRRNQEWLEENREPFLVHQLRTDQMTAEILGLTYRSYLDIVSRGERHEINSRASDNVTGGSVSNVPEY